MTMTSLMKRPAQPCLSWMPHNIQGPTGTSKMNEQYNDDSAADAISYHLARGFITFLITAVLWVGTYFFVESIKETVHAKDPIMIGILYVLIAATVISALVFAWHVLAGVILPVLILLGLGGVAVTKSTIDTARHVDESGGLKSIFDRIWYGKRGPPR